MRKELTGNEIKDYLFDILCFFSDFCDRHGLRYYLCGGTLIGAIRHKDFIPWDDDIDVMMPREDYMKMQSLFGDDVNSYYKMISLENDLLQLPFAKIVDSRTYVDTTNSIDKHLWIDIFPIDGLPDDELKSDKLFDKIAKKRTWLLRAETKIGVGGNFEKRYLRIPILLYAKVRGCKKWARGISKMSQTYDICLCDYCGVLVWGYGRCERMRKKELLAGSHAEFRGKIFSIPGCWDFYLTSLYGDYMKLPPEEKRYYHIRKTYIDIR